MPKRNEGAWYRRTIVDSLLETVVQIPQGTTVNGVSNEILNSLATQAFMDFYGITETEADGTVEEPIP